MKNNIQEKDFIRMMCKDTGLPIYKMKEIIEAFKNNIIKSLMNDLTITLRGFGKFEPFIRHSRHVTNVYNSENIEIPTIKIARFRPGRRFKNALKFVSTKVANNK